MQSNNVCHMAHPGAISRTLPTIQDRMATLFLWFTLSKEFALFTPLATVSPPCFHWSSYVRDIASSFKARSWNSSDWGSSSE